MKSAKCAQCGFVGWADFEFCKKCGASLAHSPDGSYQPQQGYRNVQPGDQVRPHGELKKGLAICSLVIGILNLFTLGLLGVGAVLGITLAIIALSKVNRNPAKYGGKGLATAGLVTSILSLVIIVPIGIIAAIAIPNLLASRRAANEGSAMYTLRKISSAEAAYQSTRETFGTLEQLAADGLIDPELASGTRHGYRFKLTVSTPEFSKAVAFEAVGVPVTYPSSGRRSFLIDETGVIREADNRGEDATRFDPPVNGDDDSSDSPPSRYRNPNVRY